MTDAPKKKKKLTKAEHDSHLSNAVNHVGAALGYLVAAGHAPTADPDGDGDNDSGSGTDGGGDTDSDSSGVSTNSYQGGAPTFSAQGRTSFRANTGASRSFRSATGRR
jgi:hypothetical protein